MNVEKFDASVPYTAHEAVWALIPWYVNGTLVEEESRLVRQHVQVCIACRKELAMQQQLSEAIRHSEDIELSPHGAYARLLERIDGEKRKTDPTGGWRHRLGLPWRWLAEGVSLGLKPQWAFTMVALFLVAGASVLLGWNTASMDPNYRTLASSNGQLSVGKSDLRVVFTERMQREQIDQLLLTVHGRIVEGPTPFGVYTIRIEDESASAPGVAAMEQLRNHIGVLFVEPSLPEAM